MIEDARILFGGAIGPSFASRFDASAADAALMAAGMSDPSTVTSMSRFCDAR